MEALLAWDHFSNNSLQLQQEIIPTEESSNAGGEKKNLVLESCVPFPQILKSLTRIT